jgi:K+ transporter
MLEDYVRIERKENRAYSDAVDHPSTLYNQVVFGTDFVVHPRPFGHPFDIVDLEEIAARISKIPLNPHFHSRPNTYEAVDNQDCSGMTVQLYTLRGREYRKSLEVQERAIADMMLS